MEDLGILVENWLYRSVLGRTNRDAETCSASRLGLCEIGLHAKYIDTLGVNSHNDEMKSSRTPTSVAARAGMLRSPEEERISLTKAAIVSGLSTVDTITAYVTGVTACERAQVVSALKYLSSKKGPVGAAAHNVLKGDGNEAF